MATEIVTTRRRRASARRVVVNVISALVMLVAVAFLVPAAFGLQRYVIAGGSMTGTYDLGSIVFEEVVPVSELQVGDVITYVPPAESGLDELVTHRIVSVKGNTFRTKGDANADVDPWTFKLTAATQPRVVFHVSYVGFLFLALQDRSVRFILIGIPAVIVALLSLSELISALRPRTRSQVAPQSGEQIVVPAQFDGQPANQPEGDESVVVRPRRGNHVGV